MVTFRAVNSRQRRWHSESLGGSDRLSEFLNVFNIWLMWLWKRVTPSLNYMHCSCFKQTKSSEEGENWNKSAQKNTKKQVNEEISWAQEPELPFFLFSTARPIPHTNSNSFQVRHTIFSGKLFRLRFSGEALNGFVFLRRISQCRSSHTFVQNIFAACAVSWLQSLAIHSSIWNRHSRSWNWQRLSQFQYDTRMYFYGNYILYLISRLPAFYVTLTCFNACLMCAGFLDS